MTPEERRKAMEERMKNMSPEERERWEARRREGGGRGSGPGQSQNSRQTANNQPSPLSSTKETTIDALFAPLPPTENRGRLWMYINKQLKSVAVRTGITDGTWTEIIDAEGAELDGGTAVVTNLVTGLEAAPRPGQQGQGGSPLMPQRGNQRGGPGGGGRGR
jgi:hypothetical protein